MEKAKPHYRLPEIQSEVAQRGAAAFTRLALKKSCPQCGAAMLKRSEHVETVEFAGETTCVEGLSGWFCSACDEAIFDDDSARRYGAAGDALIARANERRQSEIRRIRKKLKLTQVEARRRPPSGDSRPAHRRPVRQSRYGVAASD